MPAVTNVAVRINLADAEVNKADNLQISDIKKLPDWKLVTIGHRRGLLRQMGRNRGRSKIKKYQKQHPDASVKFRVIYYNP